MISVNRNLGEEPLFLARIYHIDNAQCKPNENSKPVAERWFTLGSIPYSLSWEGMVSLVHQRDFFGCWLESQGEYIHIARVDGWREIAPARSEDLN